MSYCTKCGNLVNSNAKFCHNCGTPVQLADNREQVSSGQSSTQNHQIPSSFQRESSANPIKNTQRGIVNTWYFITLIAFIGIFVPSWIGMDGMNGGFGISFLAGFAVLIGLIVIFMYRSRAKQMDKILSGEGRIACWTYLPEEWYRFTGVDFEADKKIKAQIFLLIVAVSIVVAIILMIVIRDPLILLIIAGLIVFISIPAYWAPRYRSNKLKNSNAVVLISEHGVLVGKMFHLWVGMGARLDQVGLNTESDPKIIEFSYSMPARYGRQTEIARVPVPAFKTDEALAIVEHFRSKL